MKNVRRIKGRETEKEEYHCHVKTADLTRIDDAISGCHLVFGIKCCTETSDNLHIEPSRAISFLSMHPLSATLLPLLFCLSVTQPVNWCLYINECRSIEA